MAPALPEDPDVRPDNSAKSRHARLSWASRYSVLRQAEQDARAYRIEKQAKHVRELLACIPPGVYPKSTKEGARAHVVKRWGLELVENYGNPAPDARAALANMFALAIKSEPSAPVAAVSKARELSEWKDKRARLSVAEERVVSTFKRTYGREIVFQRALDEAARRDPSLAAVVNARTAYLLAVAEGIADAPRSEEELRAAEDRWNRRWSEDLRRLQRDLRTRKGSSSGRGPSD